MEKLLKNFSRYDELHYGFQTDLIRILYYDLPEHYYEQYSSYECSKLCTILDGEKEVRINKTESFHYRSDEMILLPPHSSVEMSIERQTKALVFELGDELIERLEPVVGEEFGLVEKATVGDVVRCGLRSEEMDPMVKAISRMKNYMAYPGDSKIFLVDLAAQELAYHLLRIRAFRLSLRNESKHPVFRAIRDIHAKLLTLSSVKELAGSYNMSHTHFTHQFKRITGLAPLEYITREKMKLASKLLQELTVTETAMHLNYDNISHFIALFKKQFGITPKQYQLSRHPQGSRI
ncbi:helix-turn-helix transcriptional regulator [Paenibacillus zanthoxyli]|uniref:helix-turn-helix transcriptional regulator n=1 Tax=Paenibacillus zanthoxyli TaxID=369399 RepID=UPI0004713451|nr:AraC family transcriptional regulator [Paenibacillus zanthoxyli]